MKGLPVVPHCVVQDSVSQPFQSPDFKLHGLKLLDVIIKDLTSLKNFFFISGIAGIKILTTSVLPNLKSFGLEFLLHLFTLLRLNDSKK